MSHNKIEIETNLSTGVKKMKLVAEYECVCTVPDCTKEFKQIFEKYQTKPELIQDLIALFNQVSILVPLYNIHNGEFAIVYGKYSNDKKDVEILLKKRPATNNTYNFRFCFSIDKVNEFIYVHYTSFTANQMTDGEFENECKFDTEEIVIKQDDNDGTYFLSWRGLRFATPRQLGHFFTNHIADQMHHNYKMGLTEITSYLEEKQTGQNEVDWKELTEFKLNKLAPVYQDKRFCACEYDKWGTTKALLIAHSKPQKPGSQASLFRSMPVEIIKEVVQFVKFPWGFSESPKIYLDKKEFLDATIAFFTEKGLMVNTTNQSDAEKQIKLLKGDAHYNGFKYILRRSGTDFENHLVVVHSSFQQNAIKGTDVFPENGELNSWKVELQLDKESQRWYWVDAFDTTSTKFFSPAQFFHYLQEHLPDVLKRTYIRESKALKPISPINFFREPQVSKSALENPEISVGPTE